MNTDYFNKKISVLITGVLIGFIITILVTGVFKIGREEYEPSDEFINLSVDIDDLRDLIMLNSACDLGDKMSCDNLSKVIENDDNFKNIRISPTGQIRKP